MGCARENASSDSQRSTIRVTVGASVIWNLNARATVARLARQMSARVTCSPWQKLPVAGSFVSRFSDMARPRRIQWTCHSRKAVASNPPVVARYDCTRGTISGCVSLTTSATSDRTRALPWASFGNNGGCGNCSSMNSRIASLIPMVLSVRRQN